MRLKKGYIRTLAFTLAAVQALMLMTSRLDVIFNALK